ncbi:ABR230Cp [Eremothecium gossypii ATCC 10895]|uniref:Mediator of RNA polymerase II transcription subunit 14 n=1 Tax=Eremothecium gossypii (strain ATCC 10895 / CBS 109.51 / FGSC 9923 / NRRL Y-1056) TaxID=284811 RepID=MED14_EREGS|nr:ABR230Cp [Eremothecium gossypii ATCC 10895]Q75CZ2.2 RecName: Full=Mediator of RNA polymerase II transcription subunit 14; AltName: Full=Mediator complex subunit 14 [Eremothecium gossypii ATCC 10895]AAS51003.2 ABR230Cp [Eremothecium gossypii ATCC 10895]
MTIAVKESKILYGNFDKAKSGIMKGSGGIVEQGPGLQQRIITPAKEMPPEIPHVEFNQLPLSVLIRNLTVYAAKELSQYMKTNVRSTQDASTRKMEFLRLIIFLRNQFLRLYVLVKWCKTIRQNNFHTMIDLLNWFRGTNIIVNNCLLALKDMSTSMAGAKLPNPDLITALEVLMLGRPDLPTHGFLLTGDENGQQANKIPAKLILKRFRDLNTCLSVKISLMDLPAEMHTYSIKDGRITFTVFPEFEISLSTIDRESPLFFVDVKFLFNENKFPLNTTKIALLVNDILYKSPTPLLSLYQFLHRYVLTLQLYMIHVELQDIETNGKYSGGNLAHHYDPKKNIISLRYWLQSKMNSKCKALIGVEKTSQSIILQWHLPDTKEEGKTTKYNNLLGNIEAILDEITFNHARIIMSELLDTGLFEGDDNKNDTSDTLFFHVPVICVATAPVQLKINTISGIFYFKNPSALLLSYAKQLNQTSDLDDVVNILERLRMDKIVHILRNMFEKTGWICEDVVKLNKPILYDKHKDKKRILTRDLFIRIKDWPANWFFILNLVASGATCIVEKLIGKVQSVKGTWEVKYLDQGNLQVSKLESITYQNVMHMQKTIIQKILNHMIIDSLNELKISKVICQGEASQKLPAYVQTNTAGASNVSIIAIGLESFLQGSKALSDTLESTIFLKMDYEQNEVKLFGKFKKDTQMIRYQCDDLLINFIDKRGLAFHMTEDFTSLNHVVQYLTKFRQKLMQLVVLTDVTEKLHNNFRSEHFQIVKLRPNEISFRYLKNSKDDQDCTIQIVTNETKIEKLQVQLSPLNPQNIIQKYLECDKYDPHFIFNYLHFTSKLFSAVKSIESITNTNTMTITLHLHTLAAYQLSYHDRLTGGQIALCIDLRNSPSRAGSMYHLYFAQEDYSASKNPMYPAILQVINNVFMLNNNTKRKVPSVIRLGTGVACPLGDIEPLLEEIHSILIRS